MKASVSRLESLRSKVCTYPSTSPYLITVDLSLVLHFLLGRIGPKSLGHLKSEDSEMYHSGIKIVLSRHHRSEPILLNSLFTLDYIGLMETKEKYQEGKSIANISYLFLVLIS